MAIDTVCHLIPTLMSPACGVRDYAFRLGDALRTLGIDSDFLGAGRIGDPARCTADGFPARSVPQRKAGALEEALLGNGTDVVLLHYSGYGFAPRGAPVWLAQALRRWRAGASGRRLVVMFHELGVFGPPWSSRFWLFPLQWAVVTTVLRTADAVLTSNGPYAARLGRLVRKRPPVAVLPVFSNVGEPDQLPPFERREPVAVVFGHRGTRERVYRHFEEFLPILRSARIEGIFDIGPPIDDRLIARSPLPVTRRGYLDSPMVSTAMLQARLGLIDYPLDCVAKSGIFAAYTAHGLVPLIRSEITAASPDLRHGIHLVRIGEPMPTLEDVTHRLATAAHRWYREHNLERAASAFARALFPLGTG